MKNLCVVTLAFVALIFCGCSKEEDAPVVKKQNIWDKYVGRRITSDSEDFPCDKSFCESTDGTDNREYVEFYDLTENGITIKHGNIVDNYYDLAELSDGKYQKKLLIPYARYLLLKEIEVRLNFNRKTNNSIYYIGIFS
ncbi:MAG: hypothetical protein ACI304_00210 [Lepagella sp.]